MIAGMIARILFADELACNSPEHYMQVCGSSLQQHGLPTARYVGDASGS